MVIVTQMPQNTTLGIDLSIGKYIMIIYVTLIVTNIII